MAKLPSGGSRHQYLQDTNVRLVTCDRCGKFTWQAMSGGVPVLVDPSPLTFPDGYRQALISGRKTYRLSLAGQRPWRLRSVDRFIDPAKHTIVGAHEHFNASFTVIQVIVPEDEPESVKKAAKAGQETLPGVGKPVAPTACDLWRQQGWTPDASKCPRMRGVDTPSCNTCAPPPF